jgi:Zn-dependent peptidase ImmA (M78 family)
MGKPRQMRQHYWLLAAATQYPPQFFLQKGHIVPASLSYRKRQQVPAKVLGSITAQINIMRRHVQLIAAAQQLPVPALPVYEITDTNNPEKIAALLRRKWQVPAGPLHNLTALLEAQGIIVCHFDFGTERVDSLSLLTDDQRPIIFMNRRLQGDRQRFTLAYELGHFIMHCFCNVPHQRDVTHEANAFAAAFLLPAKELLPLFAPGITLPLLGELKRHWQQSMIALLYRADDLGLLTPNQKRYLMQQFNQQQIRRREPPELDVPPEQPQLLRRLFTDFCAQQRLTQSALATLLGLYVGELQLLYFTDIA